MKKYDYIIVGAGLYGAVFAEQAIKRGKRCLIVDRRSHIAGNCFTEKIAGIDVHRYGAHIFHTNNENVWSYVNNFAEFNGFINSPIAVYRGRVFNLPFNMNTFYSMWGTITPEEAAKKIEEQRLEAGINIPSNLEEQAISQVGKDIYSTLIKGYTEKQWGRKCAELPSSIIKRLPVRFTYDNNYFNARYQGIPIRGYTEMIRNMIDGAEVQLNTDFLKDRERLEGLADSIIYTGPIDEYFNFKYGRLNYRTVRFETKVLNKKNFQGVAVVNYTESEIPFTRIIEHKHFTNVDTEKTVISYEFPLEWTGESEPYYPVNDEKNIALFLKYQALARVHNNIHFGGRLGTYRYYDMDKVIELAMSDAQKALEM